MAAYAPPLRDMRFVYHELHDCGALAALPGLAEFTADLVDPVLEEAGKICAEVLQPLNRPGDEEGCRLENGVVSTPAGFPEAYRLFREGGWTALACDPDYGGQGAPAVLDTLISEMICSANLSFGMYPGLSHGAYCALHDHASDALKEAYLPQIVDGTWAGTMCLTEPHCGTDLGLIRSKALPSDDGSYRITGTKIFISAGEHDLTENIIHLVLAKLPGAPKGSGGISLFLVPKFRPREDGSLGPRNGVQCASLEHKMGIKASATCVLNFDDAQGWLVGKPHGGLKAMFTMMNNERLAVGVQGLGLGEASYQGAVAYARERLQGRALSGTKAADKPADPIIVHPDVRRMLMIQRATSEGCRALAVWVARALDEQTHHPDPETRKAAEDLVGLMTPIVKALLTDIGFENANLGMQVLGGHGYIREHGMEQYVRDARIAQIYEGTNGIQALDLVGRKLGMNGGRALRRFFHPVSDYVTERAEDKDLAPFVGPLAKALGRLQLATAEVARKGMSNPDEAGAAATDYLRLFGLTALAYMWARMAEIAAAKVAAGEDGNGFYAAKLATAHFFMDRVLPQTGALFSQISAGATSMMALDEAAF
ncbi:MAG: acyl-CoA dehydrogenase C-terminal domain-containing protein [Maritimibacter sp.]|uniref:acyl-CoA dehydrogenase C-terminal domain-containing protein n=1 Tax=Amaricoccus macauensis TaxID=57001 RepID=UPI001D3AA0C7|nr:acyl-CoA dehydrogenase C-terminal domain-containing protein [Maritimibacter sp.]MCB2111326.1 acyl-CoA dehydrogenase C-terminal domain-containing protein [Paracoccaceae bacterium]